MFLAYVFSLVVGGVFLGVSSIFGSKDADGGHDGGHDGDGDAHGDADKETGAEVATWLPWLSLQFWMFMLAFFGLTGTLLDGLGIAPTIVAAPSAVGMGLAAGLAASYTLHRLKHDTVESNVGASDFIGRNATVLLPVAKDAPGKVRVQVKGQLVDLVATTEDDEPLAPSEEVLVIEMRDAVALVERRSRAEGEEVPSGAAAHARREGGS